MRNYFLICCLMGASLFAEGQANASFFVFGLQGKGYYSRDKFKIPLKIGTSLSVNDELILSPNAVVKIVCNSYSLFTIESTVSGIKAAMKNYSRSCEVSGVSTAAKVLEYIWVSLKNEENDFSANSDANLQEYGAVVRGCDDEMYSNLPDTLCVYKKSVALRYHPVDTAGKYELKIFLNATTKVPVLQVKLTTGSFQITDATLKKLDDEHLYYYEISKNGLEYCQRKLLKKLSDGSFNAITKEINADKQYEGLSADEKIFAAGFFYEKNNLFGEALFNYAKAVASNAKNVLAAAKKKDLEKIFD